MFNNVETNKSISHTEKTEKIIEIEYKMKNTENSICVTKKQNKKKYPRKLLFLEYFKEKIQL